MANTQQGWRNAVSPKQDFVALFSQIENSEEIFNTDVESSLLGNGIGVLDVPINSFKVGDTFLLNMSGFISSSNSDTLTISLYGGELLTLLASTGSLILAKTTSQVFELDIKFVIRQIGEMSVASILTSFNFSYAEDSANKVETKMIISENNLTFDTTVLNKLKITSQWGQVKVSDKIQSISCNLYKIF